MPQEALNSTLSRLPQVELGTFPTPLQHLRRMEQILSYQGIYIKRDDLTGLGPGGNKTRSLEFILGDAVAQGVDTIIASGPEQSNLCTLTAAACAKLGLKCVLVHYDEEPRRQVGNQLLNHLLAAEAHFIGQVDHAVRDEYAYELKEKLRAQGKKPYVVENGATTGRGALGYVKALPELARQCEERHIPQLTIFAPGGNGGVASGLIYGNALLGQPFKIIIISVEDDKQRLCANILRTISEAEHILGLPFAVPLEEACTIVEDYRGAGWSYNTEESEQMVRSLPQWEGIFIENIYNSKVVVGMADYIRRGKVAGPVCYLHTGGFSSLFSQF